MSDRPQQAGTGEELLGDEAILPGLPPRYRVIRLLGRGREKSVFLADDEVLDRPVAIAVIESGREGEDPRRLREAQAMMRVGDHPHVVSIFDSIETPSRTYIITRYLPGGDLAGVIAGYGGTGLPLRRALRIGAQISSALERAHACGVVHRDVKPGNLLVNEKGDVLLGDFGFATARGTGRPGEVAAGTPAYLAPEVIAGGEAGPEADLYSLGCVLYELTTGAPPFAEAWGDEVLRLQQVAEVVAPSRRNPAIPAILSDLVLQLLAKDPQSRPASARDVRVTLEALSKRAAGERGAARVEAPANPRGSQAHTPARLVGRERELARIGRMLDHAAAASSRILLIEGEAGEGKSRLVDTILTEAAKRGTIVLTGQGDQDVRLPYRPFVDALLPLASRLVELPAANAERLRHFLYIDREAEGGAATVTDDSERQLLFATLFDALLTFSRRRPLVLVIDDFHWADSSSIDLFEHLAFALSESTGDAAAAAGLGLCVAYRPPSPGSSVEKVLEEVGREEICEGMRLDGMDESATYSLLGSLGIARPSDQLVRILLEQTHGNPFFVGELLHHLERKGALEERKGFVYSTSPSMDLALPTTLTSAVGERLHELSPSCRKLLVSAAFFGRQFELRPLIELDGRSEDGLLELLDEAMTQGVVGLEGRGYCFSHPLMHAAFQQMASEAERRKLHLRIATLLESPSAADATDRTIEVAHHLVRAGFDAPAHLVSRITRKAAALVRSRFAWREAAELYLACLEAGTRAGAADPASRAEIHHQIADLYYHASDVGPSLHHYGLAIDLYRDLKDRVGLASALNGKTIADLTFGLVSYGSLGEIEPLEKALEDLGEREPLLRADIMGILAECHWAGRRAERAEHFATAAMELADAEGDHRLYANVCPQIALAHFQNLRIDEALSCYRSGAERARLADAPILLDRCAQRIPLSLIMGGRLDEAEAAFADVLDLLPTDSLWTPTSRGSLAVIRGDYDAAEGHVLEAVRKLRRAKQIWAAAMALPALACARSMRDDWGGANEAMDLFTKPGLVFEDPGPLEVFTTPYRRLIDVNACRPLDLGSLDLSLAIPADGEVDLAVIPGVCAHVELVHATSGASLAEGVDGALARAEERGLVFTPGWPFLIPRIRGIAASLNQDWDAAHQHFERATERAVRVGATPELGRSRLEHAQMLAARQRPGDIARARDLARAAQPDLEACCPERYQAAASKLASYLASRSE